MLAKSKDHEHLDISTNNPLWIALIGFNDKAAKSLEIAFKNYGENCAHIVDEKSAQAVVFDFDVIESRRAWIKFKSSKPNTPTIVVASKELTAENCYVIQKPLRVGKFTAVFNLIKERLDSPGAVARVEVEQNQETEDKKPKSSNQVHNFNSGQQKPTPAVQDSSKSSQTVTPYFETSAPTQTEFYQPEKYFQGLIQQLTKESMEKKIQIDVMVKLDNDWFTVSIFPNINKIANELAKTQLKYLSSTPTYCYETKVIRHKEGIPPPSFNLDALIPIESYLWSIALWTSNARLPQGIDLNLCYRLRRWPNYTRVKQIPNALSMTAILTEKPMPLNVFLKVLNLPVSDVVTFIACTHAVGLLEKSEIMTQDSVENSTAAHKKRGIFQRIIHSLTTKSKN